MLMKEMTVYYMTLISLIRELPGFRMSQKSAQSKLQHSEQRRIQVLGGGGTDGGCGVGSASGPIRKAGGGGGCCRFLARYEGRVGEYDRVSGGPGYSTVVEFMRAGINRQRNRAAIL